jgi:neutral ceramidase
LGEGEISMKVGTAQIEITPKPGVELSGFAARIQPSTGVLDPLFAKALYLANGSERVLWIHCDLIGFNREIVLEFRGWARQQFGLAASQVMLSATHTHSGPCTIHLQECGRYDPAYVKLLQGHLREAAAAALAQTEDCEIATTEGHLDLAVDRRQQVSKHTDPRVAALGLRRSDGAFEAVVVNYPMHAVALGASNRQISADIPGQAAQRLSRQLPGNPTVLVTNGACGNLNPPAENVPFAQIEAWGGQIADAVFARLTETPPTPRALLRVVARILPLPLDVLDVPGIEDFARKALLDKKSLTEWGDKYRRAVEHWRSALVAAAQVGRVIDHRDAELFALRLGDVILLGANAEVFSEFTDWLRAGTTQKVHVVGYANGDMGYLPTRAAYAEGGYEVEVAHLFYGGFRPKAGGLELLAREAKTLLQEIAG